MRLNSRPTTTTTVDHPYHHTDHPNPKHPPLQPSSWASPCGSPSTTTTTSPSRTSAGLCQRSWYALVLLLYMCVCFFGGGGLWMCRSVLACVSPSPIRPPSPHNPKTAAPAAGPPRLPRHHGPPARGVYRRDARGRGLRGRPSQGMWVRGSLVSGGGGWTRCVAYSSDPAQSGMKYFLTRHIHEPNPNPTQTHTHTTNARTRT